MCKSRAGSRRVTVPLSAVLTATALAAVGCSGSAADTSPKTPEAKVSAPPAHAGVDYQLGGAYTPPKGVSVVSRDHTASPAPGLYNICYVNAFQAQPDAEGDWDADLLLRDRAGKVVMDKDWGEAMLDIGTPAKRARIAEKVDDWIDSCADKGFDAVEPDNYDSYTRAPRTDCSPRPTPRRSRRCSPATRTPGTSPSPRRTPSNSPRTASGSASTSRWWRSADSTTNAGPTSTRSATTSSSSSTPRRAWRRPARAGATVSIVRRDLDVTPAGQDGYVRETCDRY